MRDVKESFQMEKETLIANLSSQHAPTCDGEGVTASFDVEQTTSDQAASLEEEGEVSSIGGVEQVTTAGNTEPMVSGSITGVRNEGEVVDPETTHNSSPVECLSRPPDSVLHVTTSSASLDATSVPVPKIALTADTALAENNPSMTLISRAGLSTSGSTSIVFPSISQTSTKPSVSIGLPESTTEVVITVTKLMQVQMDAIAAQARTAAVQHLPALRYFIGEVKDSADDSFKSWLERFHEREKIAGWGKEQHSIS